MNIIQSNITSLMAPKGTYINIWAILIAYLIGCFSMSYIISKIKGINLKEQGSKNYGASNTLALIGKRAGAAVLISDILKVIIAIEIEYILTEACYNINIFVPSLNNNNSSLIYLELMYIILGSITIIGHIFPFYLKFKGGKGFASYIGLILALSRLDNKLLLIIVIALVVALVTNYIVGATFTTITLTPLYIGIVHNNIIGALILMIVSLIIFMKHFENIEHIKDGTEMKIREAFKNKYKHEK